MVFYLSYSIIVGDFIILKKDRERDEDEEKMVWGTYRQAYSCIVDNEYVGLFASLCGGKTCKEKLYGSKHGSGAKRA